MFYYYGRIVDKQFRFVGIFLKGQIEILNPFFVALKLTSNAFRWRKALYIFRQQLASLLGEFRKRQILAAKYFVQKILFLRGGFDSGEEHRIWPRAIKNKLEKNWSQNVKTVSDVIYKWDPSELLKMNREYSLTLYREVSLFGCIGLNQTK